RLTQRCLRENAISFRLAPDFGSERRPVPNLVPYNSQKYPSPCPLSAQTALQTQAKHKMDIQFQMDVVHDHWPILFALPVHQRTQMRLNQFSPGMHEARA